MKKQIPQILYCEDKDLLESFQKQEFINSHFKENVEEKIIISHTTIDSCIFEKIDFTLIELEDVNFIDVIFDGCNLSNKIFDERFLTRVVFKNCKMIGTSFIASTLKDVEFDSTILKYSNFTMAKMNSISITNTDLTESYFTETNIKNIIFDNVKLYRTEFVKTNLKNVDFSSSDINGILFDFYSLKGIIVDRFQCQDLIGILGVQIKE